MGQPMAFSDVRNFGCCARYSMTLVVPLFIAPMTASDGRHRTARPPSQRLLASSTHTPASRAEAFTHPPASDRTAPGAARPKPRRCCARQEMTFGGARRTRFRESETTRPMHTTAKTAERRNQSFASLLADAADGRRTGSDSRALRARRSGERMTRDAIDFAPSERLRVRAAAVCDRDRMRRSIYECRATRRGLAAARKE
mmetsp:Transcript_14401/g.43007  ORF Transcript_14401/g.43007 Transcript_14401/m.43007 type:complete len:200 (+) Transcript_14401:836-1435(+)